MQIEMMPIEQLVPYARNARTHSEEQIAQIAASIAEFGFTNPILIGDDDVIVAGHGRLLAAQQLGMAEVPVIVLDHLDEKQRRALVIADNKIAENAGWDEDLLKAELDSLLDDAEARALNAGADDDAPIPALPADPVTQQHIAIGVLFTVVSVVRSYAMRRVFEALRVRGAREAEKTAPGAVWSKS